MITSDDNHVVLASQIATVLIPGTRRSDHKPAAVVVKHDRPTPMIHGWSPDVQYQTILRRKWFLFSEGWFLRLEGWRARSKGIMNTGPRLQGRCCLEAVLSRNGASIGDAFKGDQVSTSHTSEPTVRR